MAYTGIPTAISNAVLSVSSNKIVILLLMNVVLLIIGTFLDATPAILIFTPIFLPIAQSLGMNAIQFGIILIYNMCIGMMTPPVGSILFLGCGIAKVSIEKVTKMLLTYLFALVVVLLLVTYIPALTLGIPTIMGLM